jgi:hypothetical protein
VTHPKKETKHDGCCEYRGWPSIADSAFGIGKALLNLGISAEVRERISDMNERILAAQESAIASRKYQATLLNHIGELERKITDLETWDAGAKTYQLIDMRPPEYHIGSAFAYAPKDGSHMGEPPHRIRATCYQEKHKSILHGQTLSPDFVQFSCAIDAETFVSRR